MKTRIVVTIIACLLITSAAIGQTLFKYGVSAPDGISVGTVVRVTADNTVAAAGATDRDIAGVVIAMEDYGTTDSVLVATTGIVSVNIPAGVTAGDRLTVGAAGTFVAMSENEDVLVGKALEDGGGIGKVMIMVQDNQAQYSLFDDSGASLGATNVQDAIDALDGTVDGIISTGGEANQNAYSNISTSGGASGSAASEDPTDDLVFQTAAANPLTITVSDAGDVDLIEIDMPQADGSGTDGWLSSADYSAFSVDNDISNELITDFTWTDGTDELSITEAGGTHTVTIENEADDLSNNDIEELQNVNIAGGAVTGDMLFYDGTAWVDLPIGSDNQVLTVNGTVPNWEAATANFQDHIAGNGLSGSNYNGSVERTWEVVYGTSANSAVEGNQTATINAGTGLSGGISADALGDGFSATLDVDYGNSAGTAVQGNVAYAINTPAGGGLQGGETGVLGDGIDMDVQLIDGTAEDQVLQWDNTLGTWGLTDIADLGGMNTNAPITGNGSSTSPIDLLYDSNNFGVDGSDQLYIITGGVNSNEILDGTIVNADVNASAAIAESKLDLDYSTSSLYTDITNNASDIATNTANIATNTSDIATNATDIANNASDIADNATDIGDLEAAVGSATGLAGLDYSSNNYVTDGASLESSVGALDAQVKTNADAIASINNAQQVNSTDVSSTVNLTATSWTDIVTLTATPNGNEVVLTFSGSFDDRGSQNGSYFELRITDGTNTSPIRSIILMDYNYYQHTEATVNLHIGSPGTSSTTYRVQYRVVNGSYDAGRCTAGTLVMEEING